jgi:hypothetical protein
MAMSPVTAPVRRETTDVREVCQDRASLRLRLRVRLTRWRLDRRLASGARADETPALALRGRQLTAHATRELIAARLCEIVAAAETPTAGNIWSPAVLQRAAIVDAREAILGLAERLRRPAPVRPGGVAKALALIVEPTSPLFCPCPDESVRAAMWLVADALGTRGELAASLSHLR